MNIFEIAAKKKVRIATVRGLIMVEDLWDLPLSSRDGFDLDTIAQKTDEAFNKATTKSFVAAKNTALEVELTLKLNIIEHVIADKLEEKETRRVKAEKRVERDRLINILSSKEDEAMKEMSVKDIQKRLAELDD